MSRDDIPEIPSFAASRDEAVVSAPRGAVPTNRGARNNGAAGSGGGLLTRLAATLGLVIAAVACAWAWQLQQVLDTSLVEQAAVQQRVADLEALLSDTDETVNQSTAALGAQLKMVDTETRRLEQRRREFDVRLDKLEKAGVTAESNIKNLQTASASQGKDLKTMKSDLAALTKVANDLERLAATARQSQESVERLADGLNKSNLDSAALKKRVATNEEWIESINAFRKQVNANMSRLEQAIRSAQSSAPAASQPMQ